MRMKLRLVKILSENVTTDSFTIKIARSLPSCSKIEPRHLQVASPIDKNGPLALDSYN
jgi:hypothetical protein